MNVEVVQKRLWDDAVEKHLESRMPETCTSGLGLGRGAQFPPPTPPGRATAQGHPALRAFRSRRTLQQLDEEAAQMTAVRSQEKAVLPVLD